MNPAAGGGIYQLNQHLDNSGVTWNATEVVDKKKSKGRTVSYYYVKVKPSSPSLGEPPEPVVSRKQFEQIKVGMQVGVGSEKER